MSFPKLLHVALQDEITKTIWLMSYLTACKPS